MIFSRTLSVGLLLAIVVSNTSNCPAQGQQADPGQWQVGEQVDNQTDLADADGGRKWLLRSPFANIGWPEIKMPSFDILPSIPRGEKDKILAQNGPTIRERLSARRERIVGNTRRLWNQTALSLAVPSHARTNQTQDHDAPC